MARIARVVAEGLPRHITQRGNLWQDRFSSFVVDEHYLLACTLYIENNAVRAKLVENPEQWRWSNAAAHISEQDDKLVKVDPLLSLIQGDWRSFLTEAICFGEYDGIRKHEKTSRPLGDISFVSHLEASAWQGIETRKAREKTKQGQ